jgi:enoyl-CoA hydratase/carnithine racemase
MAARSDRAPTRPAALVRVERSGPVAHVFLARPDQRNAVSTALLAELVQSLGDLAADPSLRATVLRGDGPDFCAGADLSEVTAAAPPEFDFARSFEVALRAIVDHPVPVIARVHGAALGAGCQIAVACDLAVAAENARLGIPSSRLGILVNFENVERLVMSVGRKRAGEILFAGREVSGAEAAAWGMVNLAVPSEHLDDRTEGLAQAVAEAAPLSVRGSKRAVAVVMERLSLDRTTEGHRVADVDMMAAEALGSEDLREGIQAFRERRRPRFRGA